MPLADPRGGELENPRPAAVAGVSGYRRSLVGSLHAAREAVISPIRPILRAVDVNEQQWRVLRVLCEEGPCDASRLCVSALLYAPSVTRIVMDLVDRGLVTSGRDPADRRRMQVRITPEARDLVVSVSAKTTAIIESVGIAFGKRRLAALQRELVDLALMIGGSDFLPGRF